MKKLSPAILFDELAKNYETMRKEIHWSPFPHIENAIRNLNITGWKCLDLGCATGETSRWLAEKNAIPVGIDISENMIAIAVEKSPGLMFMQYDLNDGIPFPDEHFDCIIAMGSLEYLPDQKKITEIIAKKLKPKAILLAVYETFGDEAPGGNRRIVPMFDNWTRYRIAPRELQNIAKKYFTEFEITPVPGYLHEEENKTIQYLRLIAQK